MSNEPKERYSDADLQEFRLLIEEKIVKAKEELAFTEQQIKELNEGGFNQQGGDIYDDTSLHTDLEMLQRMLGRQQKHIQDLKNALLRIANGTYGICIVTGELIDKQRLRAVPHATKTVDGKNMTANKKEIPEGATMAHSDPLGLPTEEVKTPGKPVGDKVRLNNIKKTKSADEWEDSDGAENLNAYTGRSKSDEDDDN